MRAEAAARGIATVIWSYPRGEAVTKDGETAIDVCAYGAQIAALLGAHIIKIKLSTDHLMQPEAKKVYEAQKIDVASQAARVRHCMEASFAGRRIVVFSGGAIKGEDSVYDDARAIRDGLEHEGARRVAATDQFHHDIDIGVAHHLEEIPADAGVSRTAARIVTPRADVRDDDITADARGDIRAIAFKHAERAGAHGTETADTHPYRIHWRLSAGRAGARGSHFRPMMLASSSAGW